MQLLTQQDVAAIVSATSGAAAWTLDRAAVQFVGVPLTVLLAAFAGALASISFAESMRLPRLVCAVSSSTAIGAYLQPPIEQLLQASLGLTNVPLAVAFATGLGAQALVGWALRSVPEVLDRLRGGAK